MFPEDPRILAQLDALLADERRRLDLAEDLLRQAWARFAQVDRLGGDGDPVLLALAKWRALSVASAVFMADVAAVWADCSTPSEFGERLAD